MTSIEKFYQYQKKFDFEYKGIHLNTVVVFYLHELALGEKLSYLRLFHLRKKISIKDLKFSESKPILSTFGNQGRKDHQEVYDYVLERVGDLTYANYIKDLGYVTSTPKIFLFYKIYKYVLNIFKGESNISLKDKFCLASYVYFYCQMIDDLEQMDFSPVKKYLCMYNVSETENLLTQYMKLKGIPTYSLCEGIYIVEKKYPNIDNINHTNLETERLLTWGKWVNDEFEKIGIPSSRMIVCGYPHKVQIQPMDSDSKMKRCMVLLARATYHETDKQLLELLSHTCNEYHYDIKCHPVSDIAYFRKFADDHGMGFIPKSMTVNECLNKEKYDFTIAVNTSAYYESLMRGVPSLRYTDGCFTLMKGYDDDFSSLEEYKSKLDIIKNKLKTGHYQKEVDEMLAYVMGVGLDNYREVLLK